jgi:hypothetical protein
MSEENVALARRYCETFNARGLEDTTELRHAEIEVFDPPEFPDAGRYVGEDAAGSRPLEAAGLGGQAAG